jgi:hypothetical protein
MEPLSSFALSRTERRYASGAWKRRRDRVGRCATRLLSDVTFVFTSPTHQLMVVRKQRAVVDVYERFLARGVDKEEKAV